MTKLRINEIESSYSFKEKLKIIIIFFSTMFFGLGIPVISYIILFLGFFLTLFLNDYKKITYSSVINISVLLCFLLYYYFVSNFYFSELKREDRVLSIPKLFWMIFDPCCLYYFGLIIPIKEKASFLKFLFFIFLGPIIFNIISIIYTIQTRGMFAILYQRKIINPFTNEEIVATISGVVLLLGTCYFSFVLMKKIHPLYKIFALVITLLSFACAGLIQTRSPIIFGTLQIVIALTVKFVYSNIREKMKFVYVFTSVVLLISAFIIVNINEVSRIVTLYFQRFLKDGLNSPRYESWKEGIRGIIEYPMGGIKQKYFFNFAHNFWLDTGNYVGIIPVLVISIFQINNSLGIMKIYSKDRDSFIFLFGILIAFFSALMVEPLMITYTTFFAISFFVLGLIKNYSSLETSDISK